MGGLGVLMVVPLPAEGRLVAAALEAATTAYRARHGAELPAAQLVTRQTEFGPALVVLGALPGEVRFVCPVCRRASCHPDDGRYGFCGNCRDFTGEPCPQMGRL